MTHNIILLAAVYAWVCLLVLILHYPRSRFRNDTRRLLHACSITRENEVKPAW
jgi:hypothetical protein